MKSFKQFYEKYTLSDVFGNNHSKEIDPILNKEESIFLSEYITQLSIWISTNDGNKHWTALKYLNKVKKKIDKKFRIGGIFYRGIVLEDEEDIINFVYFGIKTKPIASWSIKQKIGSNFAISTSGLGIVFKKEIPDSNIIINIQDFIMDRDIIKKAQEIETEKFNIIADGIARKEAETLVSQKITLTVDDVESFLWNGKKITLPKLMLKIENEDFD